ncbi:major facilitator superfamily MFS_1 [Rubrobacter xylanophilus DSM 9941]|uniref:Major facilitator superfamily MFS_1 n=1 Tax=Rubrobacter xylanophilus (strain DSM 9941 / JCM 11954 / NBRC 16129 / PRD-1) TaxID=266117 RepID=Q1AZ16_RUBXD|nr:MFS transporter [Rubrobacter xylanophilus]ABG03362.1 major facilitator superfamily MFS_1 [Rubrobacter xylanophilus DSM 9941]
MRPRPTAAPGRVLSWTLYDFASTVFSVSILSYFFPLWLADELGAGADLFNYITAASMVLVFLTAPLLGALADLGQRRKPYLAASTLLAVGCTAGLELSGSLAAAVALFVAGNLGYQWAQIFYNALLPGVAPGRSTGRVSGYGGVAGYAGTIVALAALTPLVTHPEAVRSALGPLGFWLETEGATNSNAFLPTAALYLIFGLPALLWVPDRAAREPRPAGLVRGYREVLHTIRGLRGYAGMGAFMLSTVLYMDVSNTVVANMALYGREVFGMEQADIRNLLLLSTVFAAAGAAGFGLVADLLGPKRTLMAVLGLWLAAIAAVAAATEAWMLLLAGPLVGVVFGATGPVSRVLLIALSPPAKLGEFFGFYALAGRFSAATGPALTGLILTAFEPLGTGAYRLAVLSLAAATVLAMAVLAHVPDRRPPEPAWNPAAEGGG